MDGEETISYYFERDHDEVDALLAAVDCARPEAALPRLAEFDRRLERHIVWEEEVLFPAAARLAPPLEHGPIAVMRDEHRLIRSHKLEALDALRKGDGAAARSSVERLLSVLTPHNMKEEQILYPMCDELMAGAEARRILGAIRAGGSA